VNETFQSHNKERQGSSPAIADAVNVFPHPGGRSEVVFGVDAANGTSADRDVAALSERGSRAPRQHRQESNRSIALRDIGPKANQLLRPAVEQCAENQVAEYLSDFVLNSRLALEVSYSAVVHALSLFLAADRAADPVLQSRSCE